MLFSLVAQSETSNPAGSLLIFVPLILIFYFFLIRPQRRRMQQHQELIKSIGLGDEVETIGGIFGVVRRLEDDAMWVEIAAGTTVRVARGAVRRKVEPEQPETGA